MTKTIMVVDDEYFLTQAIGDVLKLAGFKVILKHNGKECLDALPKAQPDLILLDIMMPEISGIDVAKKIKSDPRTKKFKIVFVSAMDYSTTEIADFKKIGVNGYIKKPFDNKDLVKSVKQELKAK